MSTTAAHNSKPSNEGTKRMFENPILEKLSRTHIAVPITILNSAALFVLYWGYTHIGISLLSLLWLFILGTLAFTLLEYIVHKHLFHMLTNTKFRENMQYKLHGIHHDYPKDKDRLAMPPILSATLALAFFLLFKLVMGDFAYGFLPGFLFGYTGYLFVHYIVHAWQPPNNIFKELWIHHGIHHYKDHERAYGVSSPLWDVVFRTLPKRKKK